MLTNQRRTWVEDELVVPLVVPKPQEDKDHEVGLLDVPPAPRDGHAQPPIVQVWIWGFFTASWGMYYSSRYCVCFNATWGMYCSSGFGGFLGE